MELDKIASDILVENENKLPKELKLNPFFRIKLDKKKINNNTLKIEFPLEDREVIIESLEFLKILNRMKNSINIDSLIEYITSEFDMTREQAVGMIKKYLKFKVFVPSNYELENGEAIKHWVKRGWLEALILHLKSRDIKFSDDNLENPEEHLNRVFSKKIEEDGLPNIYENKHFLKCIDLPQPTNLPLNKTLEEVLLYRRSHQPYTKNTFSLNELSNILYYASIETTRLRDRVQQGIHSNPSVIMNSSFSALELYFFAFDIKDLESGLYYYDVKKHKIHLVKLGDFRNEVSKMCIGQRKAGTGKVAFVISAIWKKYMFRYSHPRAYRNLLINIGELAQKILVLSSVYEKRTFMTPALYDDMADELLGLNGYEEAPLYVISAG
ncbi:hypothetical protein JCM12214_28720 [Geobacillus vulcani]